MIDVMIRAAQEAGAVLVRQQPADRARTRKSALDYSTQADVRAQEAIVRELSAAFQGIPIVAEEQTAPRIPHGEFFAVDPMDATFIWDTGCLDYGVAIAHISGGVPVRGIIFLPARDVLVVAERGKGCTLNGRRVRLHHERPLRETIIGTDLNTRERKRAVIEVLGELVENVQATRILSSSVGGEVDLVEGKIGAYVHLNGAWIWDYAAGAVAVEEAGGVVFTPDGRAPTWDAIAMHVIFAATTGLQNELVPLLTNAKNSLL